MSNGSSIQGLGLIPTPPAQPSDIPGLGPNFDQIPLGKDDFFPLDELRAEGGYDRKLILPDDLIPTLTLPFAWTAAGRAHVHRCQEDGALNVFVENQAGGGGGGIVPQQMQPAYGDRVLCQGRSVNMLSIPASATKLWGFSVIAAGTIYGATTTLIEAIVTHCDSGGSSIVNQLAYLDMLPRLTLTGDPNTLSGHAYVMFPEPYDLTYHNVNMGAPASTFMNIGLEYFGWSGYASCTAWVS
jgi:hypothetical protein